MSLLLFDAYYMKFANTWLMLAGACAAAATVAATVGCGRSAVADWLTGLLAKKPHRGPPPRGVT